MFCNKCGEEINAKVCNKCGGVAVDIVMPTSGLKRMANLFLDAFAVWLITIAIMVFSGLSSGIVSDVLLIIAIIFNLGGYYIICEYMWGVTFGKLTTGTKVVDMYGNKPSLSKITGRTLARLIPLEVISFLFGKYPVGWHDSLSGTFVVSKYVNGSESEKLNMKKIKLENAKNNNNVVFVIVIVLFLGIAILGILSSVILASLTTAKREGGLKNSIKSTFLNVRMQAALYEDKNKTDLGFCKDANVISLLKSIKTSSDYVCNDAKKGWVISMPLMNNKGYLCTDYISSSLVEIPKPITTGVSCIPGM